MSRQWLGLSMGVIVGGLAVAALTAPGDATGAATRTASPVEVVNFPQVQGIAGAVTVSNLPPVQEVQGMVAVNSLPLDAGGNLRVALASVVPASLFVKVADALPIGAAQAVGTDPISVTGWNNVQVFFRASFDPQPQTCLNLMPQFGDGTVFASAPWSGPGLCSGPGPQIASIAGGPVLGPDLRFIVNGSGLSTTTIEVWVYLTR